MEIVGADTQSRLAQTLIGTAANVHDVLQAQALLLGDETDAFGDAGGSDKNTSQLFSLFGFANLMLARRWLSGIDLRQQDLSWNILLAVNTIKLLGISALRRCEFILKKAIAPQRHIEHSGKTQECHVLLTHLQGDSRWNAELFMFFL